MVIHSGYSFNDFSTGHVDPGESDKETALRETQEEAGLSSKDFAIIPDFKKELKVIFLPVVNLIHN